MCHARKQSRKQLAQQYGSAEAFPHPHNTYLEWLFDNGVVGAIPVAYALSTLGVAGLPLDERQTEELILTSSQSLLAAVVIVDLRFSRAEAITLARRASRLAKAP